MIVKTISPGEALELPASDNVHTIEVIGHNATITSKGKVLLYIEVRVFDNVQIILGEDSILLLGDDVIVGKGLFIEIPGSKARIAGGRATIPADAQLTPQPSTVRN